MKRQLWGELSKESDEAVLAKQIQVDHEIMSDKRGEYIVSIIGNK